MALGKQYHNIITDELAKASTRLGRRILMLYLGELSIARAKELARDSGFLGELVDRAVHDAAEQARMEGRDIRNPSAIIPTSRYQVSSITRDILVILDSAVRGASTLAGITLIDACAIIKRKLGRRYTTQSLRALLRRNIDFHVLMVRQGRVRLRSELIVEAIARSHKLKVTEKPSPKLPSSPMLVPKTRSRAR